MAFERINLRSGRDAHRQLHGPAGTAGVLGREAEGLDRGAGRVRGDGRQFVGRCATEGRNESRDGAAVVAGADLRLITRPTMSLSDADGLSGVRRRATSRPRSRRLGSADGESTPLRARARRPGAGARDPRLRRVAGARARLRRPDRSVDARRSPAAARDGRPHHARGAPARRARGGSGRHRAVSRRRRASWSMRCARIASTTTC